jgi:hypothetical protein
LQTLLQKQSKNEKGIAIGDRKYPSGAKEVAEKVGIGEVKSPSATKVAL